MKEKVEFCHNTFVMKQRIEILFKIAAQLCCIKRFFFFKTSESQNEAYFLRARGGGAILFF